MSRATVRPGRAARQASLREHNLAVVLQQIARQPQPPSRADVAAATGLTRATVSGLVDGLLAGRLVAEVDRGPRGGAGRPAQGLVLAGHGAAGLGLEVNVDYLGVCVVDLTGAVRHRTVRATDLRLVRPAAALSTLAGLAAAAATEAGRRRLPIAGAALAVPGLVTPAGVVRLAPNLGWRDVDAAGLLDAALRTAGAPPELRSRLDIDNEANLAAIGELHAGPNPTASFLYVSGEVGVGAGIVLDGALFRGARGWSGELGHVPVVPQGPACRCGARGCLERFAGLEAILAAAGMAGATLPPDRAVARLVDLAREGDRAARRAIGRAGQALGVALAAVVNLLDIDTVVLGGMYAPLATWLEPRVRREIDRRVLTAAWSPIAVRPSRLGQDAAMIGAAGSVVRAVLDGPAEWLARAG